jgi:hypothetical protein
LYDEILSLKIRAVFGILYVPRQLQNFILRILSLRQDLVGPGSRIAVGFLAARNFAARI